jgi:hypothetical protein
MSWTDESQYLMLWYEKTQNPYFVWSAYKFFRNTNRPVPKWVLHYFDSSANRLLQSADPLRALNFTGDEGGSMLTRFLQSIEQMHIINEYAELIESGTNIKAKEILAEKYQMSMSAIEVILREAICKEDS